MQRASSDSGKPEQRPNDGSRSGIQDASPDPEATTASRKRVWKKGLWITLAVLLLAGGVAAVFGYYRERAALRTRAAKVELGDSRAQVERMLGKPAMELPPLISETSSSAMYGTSVNHVHLNVGGWIVVWFGYSTYWEWLVPGISDWPVLIKYDQNSNHVTRIRRFGEEISSQGN